MTTRNSCSCCCGKQLAVVYISSSVLFFPGMVQREKHVRACENGLLSRGDVTCQQATREDTRAPRDEFPWGRRFSCAIVSPFPFLSLKQMIEASLPSVPPVYACKFLSKSLGKISGN